MTCTQAHQKMVGVLIALPVCMASATVHGQESILPPITQPKGPARLSAAARVEVREYHFVGNTVFADEDLARVVADYAGRTVSSEELEEARRALSTYYVERGYLNSGAVLDDQPVRDGTITFRIVEGTLSEVEISGARRLRKGFVRSRVLRDGDPLNLARLQETLVLLDRNPNIERLNAELSPGDQRGTSRLKLAIEETQPYSLGLQAHNQRPPSVGGESLEVLAAHHNVLGFSDTLDLNYGLLQRSDDGVDFSELDNLSVSYEVPITTADTTLQLAYSRRDYTQIEAPFQDLDIQSESQAYTVGLTHPLIQRPNTVLTLGLIGERLESSSSLLGRPFSFSPGAVNGESKVSALRFFQEWIHRTRSGAFAFRSTFSVGTDALGITDDGTSRDGRFVKWQGQAHYLARLDERGDELVLRAGGQWANDPLLSLEQISIGGAQTVRGYRENELVRDTGFLLSAELRIPVWKRKSGDNLAVLAPFVDYGRGWSVESATPDPRDLSSAGIGIIITPHEKIYGRLFWGHAFRNLNHAEFDELQDNGLHFHFRVMVF